MACMRTLAYCKWSSFYVSAQSPPIVGPPWIYSHLHEVSTARKMLRAAGCATRHIGASLITDRNGPDSMGDGETGTDMDGEFGDISETRS